MMDLDDLGFQPLWNVLSGVECVRQIPFVISNLISADLMFVEGIRGAVPRFIWTIWRDKPAVVL